MIAVQSEKVTAQHQERQACIYIRQPTSHQVRENRESQENQYALMERALALGWQHDQIQVIDNGLGPSRRSSQHPGFQALVSAVSLGHVGLILAYQGSCLARNNSDWYILLDLAALRGVLLANVDGVFDPRVYHDRLLLSLQGMLTEAERYFQRQ